MSICKFGQTGGNEEEMKHNNLGYIIGILLAVLLALSLTACGSGGGGGGSSSADNITGGGGSGSGSGAVTTSAVSGVAAVGVPLAGGTVYVKDAGGTEHGPYPIDANGRYSIDVTGFNHPPFYLRAEGMINGQPVTLYSVSMNPGTANVNPLTNLAIAAASGLNPADVYNDPLSHPVVQADIDKAINDILTLLAPILNNPAYNAFNINPLTDKNYTADGTGLDGVIDDLDLVIDIKNGTVTISLNGVQVGQAALNSLEHPSNPISIEEIEVVLSSSLVSGSGWVPSASLSLQVGGGRLQYSDITEEVDFESTSITNLIIAGATVTISGEGTVNGVSGYTFTATVTDGTPDAMGIEIRNSGGSVYYNSASQNITNGDIRVDTNHGAASGTGSAANKSLTLNVGGNWFEYSNLIEEIDFESTSLTGLTVAVDTAMISGEGTVNGVSGYTFTATVTDGTPDAMVIEIRNLGGSVTYSSASQNIYKGDFRVIE
jgi:hypothetical protein